MVIVVSVLLSPTLIVSASKLTSPVPLGMILILALDVETISFPLTSKSPPSCGDVSLTTSLIPPPTPLAAMVTVSVLSLVVIVTLLPAANVNVSVAESATTLFCPETAIVLKASLAPLPPPPDIETSGCDVYP